MRLSERVVRRYKIAKEMTRSRALEILGLPPGASESEVMRAYKTKALQAHPDRGGDLDTMVELNIAKDILTGQREPLGESEDWGFTPGGGGGVSYPGTGGGFKPEPFKKETVTFEEARSKASIPHSKWIFVTQPVSSGYRTDSSAKYASGWVAVGERDTTWDFVVVENIEDASYYIGGGYQYDTVTIQTMSIPKKGPADAKTLYGGVMKAWKLFDRLEKRFNSKIIPLPDGWHFSNKWPSARPTSIKNFLLNIGAVSEGDLKTPRKYTIEIHNERSREEKPGFFKPKYGDWTKLTLIINGREFALTGSQGEKLERLRIGGKPFMNRVFGEYYYGGETKSLSRNRDGKKIMAWMAENLPGLSDEVETALKAASV